MASDKDYVLNLVAIFEELLSRDCLTKRFRAWWREAEVQVQVARAIREKRSSTREELGGRPGGARASRPSVRASSRHTT